MSLLKKSLEPPIDSRDLSSTLQNGNEHFGTGRLQNSIDTGVPVTIAIVYGISVECYPLQVAAAYPVRAMVGNEMEHDTVTVRHLQHRVVYPDSRLFQRAGIEVPRASIICSAKRTASAPYLFMAEATGLSSRLFPENDAGRLLFL